MSYETELVPVVFEHHDGRFADVTVWAEPDTAAHLDSINVYARPNISAFFRRKKEQS